MPPVRPGKYTLDQLHIKELERIETRFENALRDLRQYRADQARSVGDRGVLGSRGVTQFVLDTLRANYEAFHQVSSVPRTLGYPVVELLRLTETAGYAVPTRKTMAKRLTERAYRVGDVAWNDKDKVWYWTGKVEGRI